jgi:acyl-homoserine lactone acylase PvdQ
MFMKRRLFLLAAASAFALGGAVVPAPAFAQGAASIGPRPGEIQRWERMAQSVDIIRDDWGIAHVYGPTDAAVVFGMIYAQAEDDFNRVENNYLTQLGMLSLAEGSGRIFNDLRAKIFADPSVLQREYASSPAWLKTLMDAWADGLNFYIYKHPNVKPRALARFEPWMALSFTEGSIGGDISGVNIQQLQSFYSQPGTTQVGDNYIVDPEPVEPGGSNGIAVAPSNTVNKRALLLINPHTSHYFRAELQMVSNEGLNAYGAVTWGQFFIYQGFNTGAGWMHTSASVDAVDEYAETIIRKGDQIFYKYGNEERPVTQQQVTIPYKNEDGTTASRVFTVYRTHHGPIVRAQGDKWIAVKMMEDHVKALTQSYTRMKATDYDQYRKNMELHTNTSNNTLFADAKGNIAYFNANFVPKRDASFNWAQPVDGSDPRTEWQGMTSVEESPFMKNPASGWVYNANDYPWDVSGIASLKKESYPSYFDRGGASARGAHAVRVLSNKKDFTLDGLIAAAYDSYLPWFEKPLPALLRAYDALPESDPLKTKLRDPIAQLRKWDYRFGVSSIPTSLGVFWGTEVNGAINSRGAGGGRGGRGGGAAPTMTQDEYLASPAGQQTLLQGLSTAVDKLTKDFGKWSTPWGDINRFQRIINTIQPQFDDQQPSIPVGYTAATWGSLASHSARAYPNTKKWYGSSGNSFVAVVEFGPQVRAKAITAGGESGDATSKHFRDQSERFAAGNLRDVYFYKEQLKGHTERQYHPGG